MELPYIRYIKVKELLSLQKPWSDPEEHDELLFIGIHQVFEIWFKLLLHEFDKIKRNFTAGELFEAIHTFKRCRTILKTLVGQMDILETMTPHSFASFRERLDTASAFQSIQFREIEFVLGFRRPEILKYYKDDQESCRTLEKRLSEPSLVDYFYTFLEKKGVKLPAELRQRDLGTSNVANEALQEEIVVLYNKHPELRILFELMTDFDEGLQEWRYRHVKLVERTIGSKTGTAGSLGVEFLKMSLFKPVFHDLWGIRHRF